jgi:hypothetical protein
MTMKTICVVAVALMLSGCNISNDFHVTEFRTVSGEEAIPWPTGCLATIENHTQTVVGIRIDVCKHIEVGDKAVFTKDRDTVFMVNDRLYYVRSVQSR